MTGLPVTYNFDQDIQNNAIDNCVSLRDKLLTERSICTSTNAKINSFKNCLLIDKGAEECGDRASKGLRREFPISVLGLAYRTNIRGHLDLRRRRGIGPDIQIAISITLCSMPK